MVKKATLLWRNVFARRYSILIVPHHLSGARSLSVSFAFVAVLLGLWSLLTLAGFFTLAKGGELLAYVGQAELLRTQLQSAAREVESMREAAKGVYALEKDLKYLLGQETASQIAQAAAGFATHKPRRDTLDELMMGRISKSVLESLHKESNQYSKQAGTLLSWAGDFFLDRQNAARQQAAEPSEWPSIGVLTSGFGVRLSPFHQAENGEFHRGVDIANAAGTPVRAAADGVVRRAGWVSGYGRTVMLDHGFGYSSLYGHTSEIIVSEGAYVHKGDMIAYMGTTGRSTGNHLHFEVWQHGRPVNPFHLVKMQRMSDMKEDFAKTPAPVEPEGALSVLGIGVGGSAQ